jgi:Tol biopolymer transport system component
MRLTRYLVWARALCYSPVLLATACGDGSPQDPNGGGDEQIVFLSARDGTTQIFAMNVDGSTKTRISAESTADYDRLEVSRATGRVLFMKFGGETPSGVYWMKSDGSGITGPLPNGNEYRWSPDASRLVFTDNTETDPVRHVFIVNADGSGLLQITTGAESDQSPAWAPDGNTVAFQRNRGLEGTQLYLVSAQGGDPMPLTIGAMPSWAPNGSGIGFLRGSAADRGLWTVNSDGTLLQRISTAPCTGSPPAWSPDSQYLLCIAPSGLALPWSVYRVRADASESLNLTPQGVGINVYSWSRAGNKILFDATAVGRSDVFLMNADGSGTLNLTSDPQGAWQPFWIARP